MRLQIISTKASFESDEYTLVVSVAGRDAQGVEHLLTIKRDAEESFEDWGVYLECDEQRKGQIDCVSRCILTPSALHIDVSRQMKNLFGITGFDVDLQIDESSFNSVQAGLQRIFRGMPKVFGNG